MEQDGADEEPNLRPTESLGGLSVGTQRLVCSTQGGGPVIAPALAGCHIDGSFNLNVNVYGRDVAHSTTNGDVGAAASLQTKHDKIAECRRSLKASLGRKYSHVLQGSEVTKVALDKIYTELFVTEGGTGTVNDEHEVRQIEVASKANASREKLIRCNDLFLPQPDREHPVRTVLTRGVAGIGKTISVNKFASDWAEGRANQNLDFLFPLSFRELNLVSKKVYSLHGLLADIFPQVQNAEILTSGKYKVLFVLDGLDESRLGLDFHGGEMLSDVAQPTTIDVILVNLIRGYLLPAALVWVTSRPAAANQIPSDCVHLMTEVRGFSNPQKEEYFKRKVGDKVLARKIIAHVKSCRSLHIMCHIPVFCWMAAKVLERKLSTADGGTLPKTLTQMYIHFLAQHEEKMNMRLYGRRESNAEIMRSHLFALGRLAFEELEQGHLIFYEKDLRQNGIDVRQATTFSGIYTQIFSEELTLCREKVFCFIHLSVHEFFAALYVFLAFNNHSRNVLVKKSAVPRLLPFQDSAELVLYKAAVHKALQCDKGHFDIFLRFLLGLSMESNQSLMTHLLSGKKTRQKTRTEIIKHIKVKIRASLSPDRCINLFHCLNELNDHGLVEEIQAYLNSGDLHSAKLTPAQWATLVFVLLTSDEELSMFELGKYSRSEEGLQRLLPVVKAAEVAKLNGCNLTADCCETLASAVAAPHLRELDLSHNHLTDAGFALLTAGLKTSKLETLRLSGCGLTEESCHALSSVLGSTFTRLRTLDLNDNDLQDEGVKRLCAGLQSPHCKLEILLLSLCRVSEEGCTVLASTFKSGVSQLRELDLSYNHPGRHGRELLSTLLDKPGCCLGKVSVDQCGESRVQPGPKKYTIALVLDPNTAHQDLCLSDNQRKATRSNRQECPSHPERFDFWTQVLCTEGLTGRRYWEVEWSGRVCIGVAYRTMPRKGEKHDSRLGRNASSWGLACSGSGYKAWHNDRPTDVAGQATSDKVAVYLDYLAGSVTFSRVDNSALTPLHTFHAAFTEPLHPAFRIGWADSYIQLF